MSRQVSASSPSKGFHGLIGSSPIMARLYDKIERVAKHSHTVLLLGESGTGKELVARALHELSTRRERPFLALNCAAVPEALFESELFGYEKGAFTGAHERKAGQFELAGDGTLFLDEIGELSLPLQAKLLRTLQERELRRIGSAQSVKIDVRIIAATNVNLKEQVTRGRFRTDLYFRLNVVALALPALRERPEDIPLLAEHFLRTVVDEQEHGPHHIARETMQMLIHYAWPGNVRELQHAVEQGCLWCDGPVLLPEHLPPLDWQESSAQDLHAATLAGRLSLEQAVREFEREMIVQALAHRGYVQTRTAAFLGISRRQLKYRMTALGINVPDRLSRGG